MRVREGLPFDENELGGGRQERQISGQLGEKTAFGVGLRFLGRALSLLPVARALPANRSRTITSRRSDRKGMASQAWRSSPRVRRLPSRTVVLSSAMAGLSSASLFRSPASSSLRSNWFAPCKM